MKFKTWLENRMNRPLAQKGFDPRMHRKLNRAKRIWANQKDKDKADQGA